MPLFTIMLLAEWPSGLRSLLLIYGACMIQVQVLKTATKEEKICYLWIHSYRQEEIIAYPSWHSQPGFEDILNVRSQIVDVVAVDVAVAVAKVGFAVVAVVA